MVINILICVIERSFMRRWYSHSWPRNSLYAVEPRFLYCRHKSQGSEDLGLIKGNFSLTAVQQKELCTVNSACYSMWCRRVLLAVLHHMLTSLCCMLHIMCVCVCV